ncbi:MAG: histidine kinase N-terminal 7TM domain-containing protein [Haloarculaceae archaeon]
MGLGVSVAQSVYLFAGALVAIAVAAFAWQRRETPGAPPLAAMAVAIAIWLSGNVVMILTTDPAIFRLSGSVEWVGLALTPLFWFFFAAEYTGVDLGVRRKVVFSAVPLGTIALAWTNRYHTLVWSPVEGKPLTPGWAYIDTKGIVFWLFTLYAYILIGAGILLLIRVSLRSEQMYRSQIVLLTVGVLSAVVPNIASIAGYGIDLEVYALPFTLLCFSYVLFRQDMLQIVPAVRHIGRRSAVADLEDGLVVVNENDCIVYLNDTGTDILHCDQSEVVGTPITDLVPNDSLNFGTEDALADLERDGDIYEIRSSPVFGHRGQEIGHTLLFRDVTNQRRRERRLREYKSELETVERINGLLRDIHKSIVEATSRDEISDAVEQRLTDSDLYTTAHVETGLLSGDDVSIDDFVDGEVGRNYEVISEEDIAVDGGVESKPLPDVAKVNDHEKWTVVPVTYRQTVYGMLLLATNRPDAFSDRELTVLDELGEVVGYAINAVERRRLQLSDAVTELEFESTDETSGLVSISAETGGTLELEGVVPDGRGEFTAYYVVENCSADDVREVVEDHPAVGEFRCVDDEQETVVIELSHTDKSILYPLVESSGTVESVHVEDGVCRFSARIASEVKPRRLFERLQKTFPDTELVAKREEVPTASDPELDEAVASNLTDRQEAVLEAAYDAGYFEWPRDSNAEEVADALDVTPPTLHYHLRKSQDRILSKILSSSGRTVD